MAQHGQEGHEKMWRGFVDDCVAMPCTMEFMKTSAVPSKSKLAIVGTRDSLNAFRGSGLIPTEVLPVYDALLEKVKPENFKVSTASSLVMNSSVKEIVVGCVTNVASRITAKHRPDQVHGFVKKNVALNKDTSLFIVAPDREAAICYAGSAPKGHHLCQLKGSDDAFKVEKVVMPVGVYVVEGDHELSEQDLKSVNIVAQSVQLSARLVDTPTNYLNTKTYSQIVEKLGAAFGFKTHVISGQALQEQGMNVIFSVGRAAEYASALCVLSHTPQKPQNEDVVVWAGKGIVYDTGGLSLKPGASMSGMKRDMGGSAGVLGGFVASVRLGVPSKELHAVLALADNAVNQYSLRNDDVVRCLSGKTIEINNTDAEGRLVLSDAVAYADKFLKPTHLVEMATLTGAQGISTGRHYAAALANTDSMESKALSAGRATGEQCFPIPFAPEFLLSEFDSEIADMKNSVACRTNAQSACAGLFIYNCALGGHFEGEWLHVDMAYPVEKDERGTGWGAFFLAKMIGAI